MPTAIKVKDENKANIIIVRFETSTSPSWKDIRIFIRDIFFKTLTQLQKFFHNQLYIQKNNDTKYNPINNK